MANRKNSKYCNQIVKKETYLNLFKIYNVPKRPLINSSLKYLATIFNWNLVPKYRKRDIDFNKIWMYFQVLKYRVYGIALYNPLNIINLKSLYKFKNVKIFKRYTRNLYIPRKIQFSSIEKISLNKCKKINLYNYLVDRIQINNQYNELFNNKLFIYKLFIYWYGLKINLWSHITSNNKLLYWVSLFYTHLNTSLIYPDHNLSNKKFLMNMRVKEYLYLNAIYLTSNWLQCSKIFLFNIQISSSWKMVSFWWKTEEDLWPTVFSESPFQLTRKYYSGFFKNLKNVYFFRKRINNQQKEYYLKFFLKPYIKLFRFLKAIKTGRIMQDSSNSKMIDFYNYLLYDIRRKATLISNQNNFEHLCKRKLQINLLQQSTEQEGKIRQKNINMIFNTLYLRQRSHTHSWTIGLSSL